jgi:glycosyltransferase involved in cell wall biosynthesis
MFGLSDVTLILPNYAPDDEVADRALQFLDTLDFSVNMGAILHVIENGTQREGTRRELSDRLLMMSDYYTGFDYPIGYARAVNIGLAMAQSKYVIVLNNDLTLPDADWITAFTRVYESGGGGPGVLSAMDSPCQPILYDDSWYSLWMSDRKTITQVGYLDESLPFRFHDQDYSIRMHKAGFKVQRTGKVVVGHDEATTYKKMNVDEGPEKQRMLERHGVLTYREWREKGGRPFGK